jgi:hypothetical protein
VTPNVQPTTPEDSLGTKIYNPDQNMWHCLMAAGACVSYRDFYQILGIDFNDHTSRKIKLRYFELAKTLHPDKNVKVCCLKLLLPACSFG